MSELEDRVEGIEVSLRRLAGEIGIVRSRLRSSEGLDAINVESLDRALSGMENALGGALTDEEGTLFQIRHHISCPGCRGTGFVNCQRCKGRGFGRSFGLLSWIAHRDCPDCDGKGWMRCRVNAA